MAKENKRQKNVLCWAFGDHMWGIRQVLCRYGVPVIVQRIVLCSEALHKECIPSLIFFLYKSVIFMIGNIFSEKHIYMNILRDSSIAGTEYGICNMKFNGIWISREKYSSINQGLTIKGRSDVGTQGICQGRHPGKLHKATLHCIANSYPLKLELWKVRNSEVFFLGISH